MRICSSSNPNGASVSYTYDQLNRLSTVVDNRLSSGQNTTSYAYDPASNLATVTYPNSLQSTFSYDTLNRLTATSSPVFNYGYQPGPTGNWQSATEQSGRTLNWNYDGIYRLTNEVITNDPNSKNGTVGYGLDPVGNRLTQSATLPGISSRTFAFDANDRLSTETYDNNGNVLVSGGRSFKYDFQNRLKSVNNGAITLVYDGDGNRVAKTLAGATTQYLVDNLNPTGLPQVVEELANGSVQRTYTYGLNRINVNQLVNGTWQSSFYGYDGGGHVRLLTDASGTVTDTYDYDAFGNLVNNTGSTPNHYLYRGEQFDPDLGLYYLRARYYNPVTGRFLSRDPESGDPTDPSTLHKYLYARHSPVNWSDPTGRLATVEYLTLEQKVVLSAAVIFGLEQVAEAINCLYTFDGSAVEQISKYSGFGRFSIQRVGRCWAKVTAWQQAPWTGLAPSPEPGAGSGPGPTTGSPDSCQERYPATSECKELPGFNYPDARSAAQQIGREIGESVSPGSKKPATECPSGGGWHYTIRAAGGLAGSILCCPCCDDSTGSAQLTEKCKLIRY
jgi:RHS repeat-associated protein